MKIDIEIEEIEDEDLMMDEEKYYYIDYYKDMSKENKKYIKMALKFFKDMAYNSLYEKGYLRRPTSDEMAELLFSIKQRFYTAPEQLISVGRAVAKGDEENWKRYVSLFKSDMIEFLIEELKDKIEKEYVLNLN